ncbi:MAG: hypothetical protein QXY45_02040 [Candidatus Aenigmatarchaeota archaeon]
MNINKKLAILTMVITGFIFAVSFATLYAQTHIAEGTACSCKLPIPVLIPTFSSLGVFVGSFVYYLMFSRIKDKENKTKRDLVELLDILPSDERELLKMLIENKGQITQSKISKEFGKVKSFRVLESLRRRGIVVKERYGKTNMVKLEKKFEEILL